MDPVDPEGRPPLTDSYQFREQLPGFLNSFRFAYSKGIDVWDRLWVTASIFTRELPRMISAWAQGLYVQGSTA